MNFVHVVLGRLLEHVEQYSKSDINSKWVASGPQSNGVLCMVGSTCFEYLLRTLNFIACRTLDVFWYTESCRLTTTLSVKYYECQTSYSPIFQTHRPYIVAKFLFRVEQHQWTLDYFSATRGQPTNFQAIKNGAYDILSLKYQSDI